jgi:hypothetical protein
MRADLHAESGAGDLARAQYELVAKSTSPARAVAASRLAALDEGGGGRGRHQEAARAGGDEIA